MKRGLPFRHSLAKFRFEISRIPSNRERDIKKTVQVVEFEPKEFFPERRAGGKKF
jgi:hypothetical protein